MMNRVLPFLALLCCLPLLSLAQSSRVPRAAVPQVQDSRIKFIENRAQFDPAVAYMAELGQGGRLWLGHGSLTWVLTDVTDLHERWHHRQENTPLVVDAHAWRVDFPGADPAATIEAAGTYPEYQNYFIGNDPSRWATGVPLHAELRYRNLWPGIDMLFYGKEQALRYDFVLAPGADPSRIRMQYTGADGLRLERGALKIQTSIREITEQAPRAWQDINGVQREVPVAFVLDGNTVRFELGAYDPSLPLVIDPTLVFATYTGSTADNFGYTATYDDLGNAYAGGIAFGVGYPSTVGAFQVGFGGGGFGGAWNMNGGVDISLTKFNPTGTAVIWATYLGGSDNEQPHSLITNAAGELFVYGKTYSANYPVSVTAYDNTLNGAGDIVVSRFNAAGTALLGSTFIGGSGEDGTNITTAFAASSLKANYGDESRGEIILDAAGNVYVASCTQSGNFPTQNAFQPASGGGTQDAVVFRMNAALSTLDWSSYLGGGNDDAAYSLKLDAAGNTWVTGGTLSANFPVTAGSFGAARPGGTDGFISQISPTGNTLLGSSYIGTSAYDQAYFVEIDLAGDIYVYGQTLGAFPVTAGQYSNANGKQFLMKIKPTLASVVWSTVFGSGGIETDISPTAFLVDICGYIYVSGWGGAVNFQGSTLGMPTTFDAFQATTDGSDIYLAVFKPDAVGLEYGTFLGGPLSAEHVDGGTSRFNKNLEVYHAVCAGCGSNSDFPTTPGAVSATNNSFNCNLACFKFAFTPQSVVSAFTAQNLAACAPFPVNFTNNSTGGVSYIWNFGDNSPTDTSFSPSHTYILPGTYTVTLIAIDSNSCNISDTVTQTVTVYANPIASISGGGNICGGGSVTLMASGGGTYLWSPAASLSNPNISNPVASPLVTTTYTVIVTSANGCRDTSDITVNVSNFTADAGPPASFCLGTGGALLTAGTPTGGVAPYYYEWWCDSTNTFCGIDSIYDNDPQVLPTQSTWYYLQMTDATGCQSQVDSVFVTVLPIPVADAGPDQYICPQPAPGALLSGSFSNAPGPFLNVHWIPGTGLNDSTLLSPYARPDTTTIYTLVGTSSNGCTSLPTTLDTLSTVTVHVYPRPIADAGPDRDICFGDTTQLRGTGYNAGPVYDFEWSPWNSLSDSVAQNPFANPLLTTEYILNVWSNGCPSYGDTVRITVHTLPTIDAGPDRDRCLGDSVLLDAQAGGDSTSTAFTYLWTPATGLNDAFAEDPLAAPDTTTLYYVEATSSWGCGSGLDSVLVTVRPTPFAEAGGPLALCAGDTLSLPGTWYYTSTDTTAPGGLFFSWTPAATLSDSTVTQPQAWPSQSTWYHFSVTNTICTTTDSVLVLVSPQPGATAWADTTVSCQGDSVQLHATGGLGNASFTWTPATGLSDPFSAHPFAAPDSSLTYTLVVAEGACADTLTVPLNILPTPVAAVQHSLLSGCVPLQVDFTSLSSDALNWSWLLGDGTVSNDAHLLHTYTTPGTWYAQLIVTGLGGCADSTALLPVTVYDTLSAAYVTTPDWPADLWLPGGTVDFHDLTQPEAVAWNWNFGDGTQSTETHPTHLFTEAGTYYVTLTVTSAQGCQSRVTHGPWVVREGTIDIPNVFTPNDDLVNDEFRLRYTGSQPFTLTVFDRWGVQMFSTQHPHEGWDGTVNEHPAPEGVYYYVVHVGDREFTGTVTLLR